jgi:hypothetical protein
VFSSNKPDGRAFPLFSCRPSKEAKSPQSSCSLEGIGESDKAERAKQREKPLESVEEIWWLTLYQR